MGYLTMANFTHGVNVHNQLVPIQKIRF